MLTLLATVCGCERGTDPKVEFILPNGYRGPFAVLTNKEGGEELKAAVGGRYKVKIPRSGKLLVKGNPLKGHRDWGAFYADGTRIVDGVANPNGIGFYEVFEQDDGSLWFLIGTEAEMQSAWKANAGMPGRLLR